MVYSFYQLLWLYMIYSFIGWCGEVVVAAVKRHRFVNRGAVSGPFCPIYGLGAAVVAVFFPELKGNPLFLFLGGMVVNTFVEYVTGRIMEMSLHKKWWDYSDQKFNLGGYVCLKTSVLWGICTVLMIYVLNPVFTGLVGLIPKLWGEIILWVLFGLLIVDFIGTVIAVWGLKKKNGRIDQIREGFGRTSKLLENTMTRRLQARMIKAYPNLEKDEKEDVFASGCGFYKLACLFFIGAFLGDITETVFCRFSMGRWMSRSSVVFGPFSIVWGLGCAMLTWILYRYREQSDRRLFLCGTILGGAYEYICSVFTEIVFGTVFWDYSKIPFNLGGRINLLYCFFWGFAAIIWMKGIYPFLSRWIEKIPVRIGKPLCMIMVFFMSVNIALSGLALDRYSKRHDGLPAKNAVGELMDDWFPDPYMEKVYPNIKFR
ncbi:UNVERIFIED_CONTAM: putative ABC transporter permease [Blautia caecimuris]